MNTEAELRWWLHLKGQTQGPFTVIDLGEMQKTHQLSADVLACALGDHEWKPLSEIRQLQDLFQPSAASSDRSAVTSVGNPYASNSLEKAKTFPRDLHGCIARWVGYYLIFALPAILGLHIVVRFVETTNYDNALPVHRLWISLQLACVVSYLVTLVLSILAGLRWQESRASALVFTAICLGLSLVWDMCVEFIGLFSEMVLLTFMAANNEQLPEPAAISGWDLFLLILGIFTLVTHVAILGWMLWARRSLSWK